MCKQKHLLISNYHWNFIDPLCHFCCERVAEQPLDLICTSTAICPRNIQMGLLQSVRLWRAVSCSQYGSGAVSCSQYGSGAVSCSQYSSGAVSCSQYRSGAVSCSQYSSGERSPAVSTALERSPAVSTALEQSPAVSTALESGLLQSVRLWRAVSCSQYGSGVAVWNWTTQRGSLS